MSADDTQRRIKQMCDFIKQEAQEKANEIKLLLGAIKKQYDMFDTVLTKVKRKINEADQSLDEATKRNNLIKKKLKDIDAADSIAADNILGISENSEN